MKKISKIILGGVLFLGCALTLSGCSKSGLNGTYEQSITTAPTGQSISKKYAPKVIYHITNHDIYAQPLQPHFKKISKENLKSYKEQIKKRIKFLKSIGTENNSTQNQQQTQGQQQTQNQQQAKNQSHNLAKSMIPSKNSINKHINIEKKYTKRSIKDYQDFKIKDVKKHGKVYTFKGQDHAHIFGVTKHGKNTTKSRKSKVLTVKIKKTKHGIKLLSTHGKLSINRQFHKTNEKAIKKLFKQDYIKPSQDGYSSIEF